MRRPPTYRPAADHPPLPLAHTDHPLFTTRPPLPCRQGLEPLVFHFNTTLESATASLDAPILPPTHNTSGLGYVCCGAVRNFRVPDIPEEAALNLKARELPRPPLISPHLPRRRWSTPRPLAWRRPPHLLALRLHSSPPNPQS